MFDLNASNDGNHVPCILNETSASLSGAILWSTQVVDTSLLFRFTTHATTEYKFDAENPKYSVERKSHKSIQ